MSREHPSGAAGGGSAAGGDGGPGREGVVAVLAGAANAEDAAAAGAVLVAAGTLLRRSQSFGVSRAGIDGGLRDLPREAVVSWLASEPAEAATAALALAVDEAIEAALADDEGERRTRSAGAFAALAGRDRLESALAGLARYEAVAGALVGDGSWRRDQLAHQVARLDGATRRRARALAALNAERRRERDTLDQGVREAAWWYADRADCDALAQLLAGKTAEAGHLASCAQCRADVEATAMVDTPPSMHVSEDDLWRLEAGELDALDARRVSRHAERCAECALALSAMRDGEAAVEEAS
ncbi:MAG: hypothetical protein WKG00_27120 [Polyangiaceae bacterium]